jgi:hypothetical protein
MLVLSVGSSMLQLSSIPTSGGIKTGQNIPGAIGPPAMQAVHGFVLDGL